MTWRRIHACLAVLSLLAAILASAAWIRSLYVMDRWIIDGDNQFILVLLSDGCILVVHQPLVRTSTENGLRTLLVTH